MAIDARTETLIPLKQAVRHLPGSPHIATIYRFIQRRHNALESLRCGGRWYTSREACLRFVEVCTADGSWSGATEQATSQRRAQIDAANKCLDAAGI